MITNPEVLARLGYFKAAYWEVQQAIHKAIYHDGTPDAEELAEVQKWLDKWYPRLIELPPHSKMKGGKMQAKPTMLDELTPKEWDGIK